MKKRNPVLWSNSVDALDLMTEALKLLLRIGPPAFLDRLREQILLHRRQLRHIIGSEEVEA